MFFAKVVGNILPEVGIVSVLELAEREVTETDDAGSKTHGWGNVIIIACTCQRIRRGHGPLMIIVH
jgi:hypothetical protein